MNRMHGIIFAYEQRGELRELTTLDDSNTMLNIQNGNLYLLRRCPLEAGTGRWTLPCPTC